MPHKKNACKQFLSGIGKNGPSRGQKNTSLISKEKFSEKRDMDDFDSTTETIQEAVYGADVIAANKNSPRKKRYRVPWPGKILIVLQVVLLVDAVLTYYHSGIILRFFLP
jgi:hypothetical protein